MGIGPSWFSSFFFDLCRDGHVKRGDAILDIGASELFFEGHSDQLNEMLRFFELDTVFARRTFKDG